MIQNKYILPMLLMSLCGLASAKMNPAQIEACKNSVKGTTAANIKGTDFYNCKASYQVINMNYEVIWTPNPRVSKDVCFAQAKDEAKRQCDKR